MTDRQEDPVSREEEQSTVASPGQRQNSQQVPIMVDHDAETEILGDGADIANLEEVADEEEVVFLEEVVNRPAGAGGNQGSGARGTRHTGAGVDRDSGAGGNRNSGPGGNRGSGARGNWFNPNLVQLGRSLPLHPTPRNEDADVDIETPFVPDIPRLCTGHWLICNRPESDSSSDSDIEVGN